MVVLGVIKNCVNKKLAQQFMDVLVIKRKTLGGKGRGIEAVTASVNRVVEFPVAGLGRLITINFELNGAI